MKIRLLETAQDDLRAGFRFYEDQSPGLGEYFLDCLQADVRSLQIYGGVHEQAGGFFRMLAKRFPFAVYYLVDGDQIDVYAILDCRRDPTWVESRLREIGSGAGTARLTDMANGEDGDNEDTST